MHQRLAKAAEKQPSWGSILTHLEKRWGIDGHGHCYLQALGIDKITRRLFISCKVSRAEVKVVNFIVEHNVPIAVTHHLSPLVREIFTDSEIAKWYASCRTKTTSMINLAIAPHFQGMPT